MIGCTPLVRRPGEFERAEQVAGVGDGDGRLAVGPARAAILSALMAPS